MNPRVWGEGILLLLSAAAFFGTWRVDFNRWHVFNPEWPAHARFHAALYALMTLACAALSGGLILLQPFGPVPSLRMAVVVLTLMGGVLFLALLVPGVSAVAYEEERQWRGIPISLWMGAVFLLLTAAGGVLVWQG